MQLDEPDHDVIHELGVDFPQVILHRQVASVEKGLRSLLRARAMQMLVKRGHAQMMGLIQGCTLTAFIQIYQTEQQLSGQLCTHALAPHSDHVVQLCRHLNASGAAAHDDKAEKLLPLLHATH